MLFELDNTDVLFRLGGPPRIGLLTAGNQDFIFQFVKKIKLMLLLLLSLKSAPWLPTGSTDACQSCIYRFYDPTNNIASYPSI